VEQNVAFSQQLADISLAPKSELDPTFLYGSSEDATLGAFCARPIKVAEINWTTAAGSFSTTIDPWSLVVDNAYLKKRIEGYRLLHGKLHVRIVMNGNPFLYGMAMASYYPREYSSTYTMKQATDTDAKTCEMSMKPFIFLNPTSSEAGEMILPFFSPDNWIDLTGSNVSKMGRLVLRSFNNLRHSNASSGAVQITVFAWLDDANLAAPTQRDYASYTIQSGDEYDNKPSAIASTIAKASGLLSRVPVIGKYARSTEIMASMLSSLASSFGFARPTVIEPICRIKHFGNGNMANVDQSEAVVKLSLDSKQELSIDPRTTGLAGDDELLISSIATRYAFIRTAEWSPTQTDGTVLATILVNPLLYVPNSTSGAAATTIINLPCCTIAALFNHWKGSMKYRFQIVASALHRGRLRVHYDPCTSPSEPGYNQSYTRIIDLASQRDFEFEVSWNASKGCLRNDLAWYSNPRTATLFSGATFDPAYHNGTVTLTIVNALTAPDPTISQAVYVNMFACAGDDFEVADPTDLGISSLCYTPQSGFEEEANVGTMTLSYSIPSVGHKIGYVDPSTHSYMGESIVSLRSILKRYCFHSCFGAMNSGSDRDFWWQEYNFPYYSGFLPGAGSDEYRHTGPSGAANLCAVTPLNWIVPTFVGWRGGLRSKFLARNVGNLIVRRNQKVHDIDPSTNILYNTADTDNNTRMVSTITSGFSGLHAVSTYDGSLEVEFPFYSNQRFAHAREFIWSVSSDLRAHSASHVGIFLSGDTSIANRGILRFVSVGEDFNVFFFIGQPLLSYGDNTRVIPSDEIFPQT